MSNLANLFLIFLLTITCPLFVNALSDCNGTCTTGDDCSGQLTCIDRKCNDDPDVGTDICKGGSAAPTPPPIGFTSNCNGPCNHLGDCLGQLICINRKCNDDPDMGTSLCKGGGESGEKKKTNGGLVALFIIIPLLICILLSYLAWHFWRKKHSKKEVDAESNENLLYLNLEVTTNKQYVDSSNLASGSTPEGERYDFNLPHFSFSSISAATNNFSPENKLGEGGFGPVYKGNLIDGNSVAVKRLSQRSGQGLQELRNETVLIAKLQHRNLVRIVGCCIEQDEKILIYEYLPNKSLDLFIFDPSKQFLLDWSRRVQIIEGIAQGLLYLHKHSRLRIVHRDMKASNILLDDEMNPKISDFGMARIFGEDELQANTNRIVGTYGYMSPEYAMEGLFSVKSDVFAFGVLLLEILSGKKNTGFRDSDCLSLLGYAWGLWKTERVLDLIDSNLELPSSFLPLRYIHVGLLCVQESPADRPTMSDVIAMFSNELIQLSSPNRPPFTTGGSIGSSSMIKKGDNFSVNDLSATVMHGR
ncbi:hypothetical protein AgCh_020286 [Apium graveolens]